MRKSLVGLAGIVLLSVYAGCGTKTGVETPPTPLIMYHEEKDDGSSLYFTDKPQEVKLVPVKEAGKKDDFVFSDDKLYEKIAEGKTSQEPEQSEEPQQPEPTEPEYVTNKEFQTMQGNYDDRFNILDNNYKELRNDIHEIKKMLKHASSQSQDFQSAPNLAPVQPRN